jgi:hypothetical protein
MSNIDPNAIETLDDDLSPEYRFNYSSAKPNRFAPQTNTTHPILTIELDPDIAALFPNAIAVNEALRLLIKLRQTTRELDSIVAS